MMRLNSTNIFAYVKETFFSYLFKRYLTITYQYMILNLI